MFIKKTGSGDYYLFRRTDKGTGPVKKLFLQSNIFLVKAHTNGSEGYAAHNIVTPKELIGKRIMLRIEVIE